MCLHELDPYHSFDHPERLDHWLLLQNNVTVIHGYHYLLWCPQSNFMVNDVGGGCLGRSGGNSKRVTKWHVID